MISIIVVLQFYPIDGAIKSGILVFLYLYPINPRLKKNNTVNNIVI